MIGRVRHRATFTELRRRGTRAVSGPIAVTFLGEASLPERARSTSPGHARVAFAVPRRIGTAVVRNRVRRRLRSIFLEAGDRAPAGAYLVAVRPGAPELTYRDLTGHVHRALDDIGRRRRREPAAVRSVGS